MCRTGGEEGDHRTKELGGRHVVLPRMTRRDGDNKDLLPREADGRVGHPIKEKEHTWILRVCQAAFLSVSEWTMANPQSAPRRSGNLRSHTHRWADLALLLLSLLSDTLSYQSTLLPSPRLQSRSFAPPLTLGTLVRWTSLSSYPLVCCPSPATFSSVDQAPKGPLRRLL